MDDRELVVSRARNAVISRDFELAIRLYNALLAEEPANEKYLEALGNISIKLGNDEKAIPYFESILNKSPSNFNALNSIGGIYRRLHQYDKAIDVLKKAFELDRNNPEINYNLGFTYKSMGNNGEAIDCFKTVIAANPSDVLAYNHLASIYAQQQDYEKAIITYKKGLQIDPNHPILQYNLAKACQATHDDISATAAFETALRAKPGWTDAVTDYAELLLSHRKTRAAAALVKNAIELNSTNAELYALHGKICLRQYNCDEAIQSLEKADSLNPQNAAVLATLAEAYIRRGKKADAVFTSLKAAEADGGKNLNIIKKIIDVLLSAAKYDAALSYLRKAAAGNKDDSELLDLAGQYYITQKKDENAASCEERLKKTAPSYSAYLANWAKRYHETGRNEKSRALYQNYLDENNKDACAWVDIAVVDEELGNTAMAADEYAAALAFDPANYAAKTLLKKLNEKLRDEQETLDENPSDDFDLENFIDRTEGAPAESALPEMEEIDIFEFDESETAKKTPGETAAEDEKPSAEETEAEENPSAEELVDSGLPVESLLDYTDEDKPLSDLLVDDKDVPEETEAEPENPETEDEPEEKPADEQKSDKFPYGKFIIAPNSKKEETEDSELPQEPVGSAQASDAQNNEVAPQEQKDEPQAENEAGAADSEPAQETSGTAQEAQDNEQFSKPENFPQMPEDKLPPETETAAPDSAVAKSLDSAKQQLKEAADEAEQKLGRIADDIQEKADALQNQLDSFNRPSAGLEPKPDDRTEAVSEEKAEAAASGDTEKYTKLLNQVENILPVINRMLEDKELAQKFSREIMLFKQLRELGGNLPDESKQQFMTSKTRLLLDFLIARLSGRPGLLRTSKSLRKSGIIDEIIEESSENDDASVSERAEKVIMQMRALAKDLPDKTMAQGLLEISDSIVKNRS